VTLWLSAEDAEPGRPEWARPFDVSPALTGPVRAPWGRHPDDFILLYTGGTTGNPKGVMWRQDDVFAILNSSAVIRYRDELGLEDVLDAQRRDSPALPRFLPCGPLIHGTAGFSSYAVLGTGGGGDSA
jgi:acyl-CoA synthetase (AMP-forming)/AMP-acid ligase II